MTIPAQQCRFNKPDLPIFYEVLEILFFYMVLSHLVISNYSPPGFSVHGIFQARILEWVAISSCKGSSQPRDQTRVSCIGRHILYP